MHSFRFALAGLLLSVLARCAEGGGEGECETDTGGTCSSGVCFIWRNALCTKGQKCTCPEGECSKYGECIPVGFCSRVTSWNCNMQGCPNLTNSVCSPKPAFPAPCAAKFAEFFLGLMGLGIVMCCGFCVCVYKHSFHGLGAVLSVVAALGIGFVVFYMYSSITKSCLAVGILHQSGYDVPTVPLGWDAPKPATLIGIGSAQMQKCVCPQGSCAMGNECVADGECPKFTGGNCKVFGCASSRKATCKKIRTGFHSCLCGEDECAKDGACVPKAEHLIALGNFSARRGWHGGHTTGADSMAAKERGSAWALIWAVAVAGMAMAAVFATMASRRGRGRGSEPLLAEG